MEYPKEPFDFKLFILKMLEKWYQFVLWTVAGALLFGSTYYLYKVAYAPAKEYQASATYYIEYVTDPVLSEQASYFNAATLDSWLTMDVFTNQVLPKLSTELTVEELNDYVELIMPSDIRVVELKVLTPDPVLSMEILSAYDEAFAVFGANQREINKIVVQDISREAQQIKADIRTQRAFVLGSVLGLVLGGLYIILHYMMDDGIYLPITLAKRHGLRVFGTDESEELSENISYAVKGYRRVAVTCVGDIPVPEQVCQKLQSIVPDTNWIAIPTIVEYPEVGEVLRKCDGLIITVVSGVDKSGSIDRALAYYAQQEVSVTGAILWDADQQLLKRYMN